MYIYCFFLTDTHSYGGSISGTSAENLVIFSGTVFQEILIWRIGESLSNNEDAPVLHRLTGHQVSNRVLENLVSTVMSHGITFVTGCDFLRCVLCILTTCLFHVR